MKTSSKWLVILLISGSIFSGCTPKAKYERMLKRELSSGVRFDSLFMGFYFGMPEKEFYVHCWNMNKKGLFRQDASNTSVEYQTKDELKYPATMDFYPKFHDGKISEMPVRYVYKGWAPWNKTFSSDNLQMDVLNYYKKTYGGGFMEVRHPKRGKAFVKMNGNRRITIFKEDELHVWAIFTDMLVKKGFNNASTGADVSTDSLNKDLKK